MVILGGWVFLMSEVPLQGVGLRVWSSLGSEVEDLRCRDEGSRHRAPPASPQHGAKPLTPPRDSAPQRCALAQFWV